MKQSTVSRASRVLRALGALGARQGFIFILIVVVNWTVSDRIGQSLAARSVDPLVTTVICNSLYLVFLAVHGLKRLCARAKGLLHHLAHDPAAPLRSVLLCSGSLTAAPSVSTRLGKRTHWIPVLEFGESAHPSLELTERQLLRSAGYVSVFLFLSQWMFTASLRATSEKARARGCRRLLPTAAAR